MKGGWKRDKMTKRRSRRSEGRRIGGQRRAGGGRGARVWFGSRVTRARHWKMRFDEKRVFQLVTLDAGSRELARAACRVEEKRLLAAAAASDARWLPRVRIDAPRTRDASRAHLGWMPFRMQSLRKSASLS